MRRVAIVLAVVGLLFNNHAIAQSVSPFLSSNPIALALTIGQWLIKDLRKVYYIQVKSTAETIELARAEGFKYAVSQAVGTLVLAETVVKNNELNRKDIIQYSSGYVEDFKVLQEIQLDGGVQIIMDVWVSDSKIADRLLYVSKGNSIIDGAKASTQHQTLISEKNNGDKLLEAVLNDFPERAFDVVVGKTTWRTVGRSLEIYIPINLSWNEVYINAIYEILIATRNDKRSLQEYVNRSPYVVMIKKKSDLLKTYAGYSDSSKSDMIEKAVRLNDPMILLHVKNNSSEIIYSQCFKIEHMRGGYYGDSTIFGHYGADRGEIPQGQFFSIRPPDATVGIYGDYKLDRTIRLVIDGPNNIVENMKAIEVKVVKSNECPIPKLKPKKFR
jgi:hypothetical protein